MSYCSSRRRDPYSEQIKVCLRLLKFGQSSTILGVIGAQ